MSDAHAAAQTLVDELATFALEFPEAWGDTPWDEHVVKVRKKIFLFHSTVDSEHAIVTMKVPESRDHALSLPGASPTNYGLGRHGWVTINVERVPRDEREVLFDFVEESYRAVAPKTLVKHLGDAFSE